MKKIIVLIGLILMIFTSFVCEAAPKKVALTSFVNAVGNNYGKFVCTNLENEVLNGLVQNKNYTVVERAHLDRIFQELGLQNSGVVDSSSAIENCGFPLLDASEIKALAYQLEVLYEKIIHNLGHINGLKLLRNELLLKLMNSQV